MHNTHALQPKPRSWVIIDIESAVTDESGHRRYMATERWVPAPGKPSRRSYERSADPLQTPRWPFQTIVAAAIMILVEHDDGNVDVASFTTLSAGRKGSHDGCRRRAGCCASRSGALFMGGDAS